jgi:SAM-dependent methyltransferase
VIEPNYISYKDTAARVVKKDTFYFRYIFLEYKAEYDHLMKSGLYQELVQLGLLIEHREIEIDTDDPKVYKQLFPENIQFQSYPFEWSYSQWRKAILAYLKINNIALKYGMILKDATPYNFYLFGGNAIMFDTSSFIFFHENDKWIAYRQFCEEFLSPIALMYYNGAQWSKLTMANLKGMPLNFVSENLPIKSWFNLTTLLHIHFHSKFSTTNKLELKNNRNNKGFTLEKVKTLQKMIFYTISKWKRVRQKTNHWSNYYEKNIESQEYLKDKEVTVRKWLEKIKPETILDLGANTGKFSFIAAEYSKRVISLEADENCVDVIESNISKNTKNVFTLVGNVAEPSPNLGLMNSEIENIYNRCNSELVLGLALFHHLHIFNKLSFEQIISSFSCFATNYLIIEFIEKNDNKINFMKNNISDYSKEKFIASINSKLTIVDYKKLDDSERYIFLIAKNYN